MVKNSDTSYRNIIFDLVGVLFRINKLKLFSHLGVSNVAAYMLTHRKNPLTQFFKMLDKIANQEENNPFPIKYKSYLQPKCISDLNLGLTTNKDVISKIECKIHGLDNQKYFSSRKEKKMMVDILKTCLNTTLLVSLTNPITKTIELVKELKNNKHLNLYIISNIDKETFFHLNNLHKSLFCQFNDIILSCNVSILKPNPKIFHHLLAKHKIDPKASIFIDDQQENTTAAEHIGITSIQFKKAKQVRNTLIGLDVI